jgi:hypothetical protein
LLKPALLYTEQIIKKFTEQLYTTDYFYYCGYPCGNNLPKIEANPDLYQYAVVDKNNNVIGFFTYRIDDYTDSVKDFGLFSFDKGNSIVVRDVLRKLEELVKIHHRIEWGVIGTNPVKRHYDKFCKKYNGYIHQWHEASRDECGKYIDSYTYEIVQNSSGSYV